MREFYLGNSNSQGLSVSMQRKTTDAHRPAEPETRNPKQIRNPKRKNHR
jgi:hypothetical protein